VLDEQAETDILIIEDEPVIAMDIAGIIRQAGHRVLGIATTRDEAVAMARATSPGLILADIKLADASSGIKAVDDIVDSRLAERPGGGPIPVIFITAFPERLLNDERVEPSLLITKPFSEHLLRVAIARRCGSAARARPPWGWRSRRRDSRTVSRRGGDPRKRTEADRWAARFNGLRGRMAAAAAALAASADRLCRLSRHRPVPAPG
jgi:CheY-like chemotaxis protein